MREPVLIKSSTSDAVLEFANNTGDYFDAVLSVANFRGAVKVYDPGIAGDPADFLEQIARECEGWKGEKKWSSLEGELSFAATSDLTGHTMLRVSVQENTAELWRLDGFLILEAGQLERIARSTRKFFDRSSS